MIIESEELMSYYKIQHATNPELYRIAFTLERAQELKTKLGAQFKITKFGRPIPVYWK